MDARPLFWGKTPVQLTAQYNTGQRRSSNQSLNYNPGPPAVNFHRWTFHRGKGLRGAPAAGLNLRGTVMTGKLTTGCAGTLFVSDNGQDVILRTVKETGIAGEYEAWDGDGRKWLLVDSEDSAELVAA